MHPRLSARQEQCLRLTAFRTDKEIAAHLGISEATVKKHVHEACQRLGVNRRKAALALLDPIVPDTSEGPAVEPKPPVEPSVEPSGQTADDDKPEVPAADPADGARLGYRPPPRNPAVRIALIVGLTIILAAFVATTVVMLGEMHEAVGKIDAKVYPGVAKKKS
ncbi:helix-turn-helix domain-containing protein [Brevundimonas goettingensis]|uniref:HTH luxR-type domain-containing protein n=1 Tax=Brevundimonas goettingensis TaxID=2774190 RepID=A0A975GVU4_9CAUL|nr:helix-turn-helix transcriptional regulator [Brevundimonas goettingensis]QTC90999.1 hypothetical protein IFJ75_17540 [Brevundimonas goettingensis]